MNRTLEYYNTTPTGTYPCSATDGNMISGDFTTTAPIPSIYGECASCEPNSVIRNCIDPTNYICTDYENGVEGDCNQGKNFPTSYNTRILRKFQHKQAIIHAPLLMVT